MKIEAIATVLVSIIVLSSAHLCMVNPKQRGSITGLDKAGSDDCILTTSPCGGRDPQTPNAVYKGNENVTVIFQKNLDHWVKTSPGYFSVNVLSSKGFKELGRIMDAGEPSLTLYTGSYTLSDGLPKGNTILQVVYVTKNPQAPPMFYQCADIDII